ncbi:MAG: hypothetical protein ACYTG2_07575 [Planctomycetota bacterium]|jgi:hypothetical protein
MAKPSRVETYAFSANEDGVIRYEAPDGQAYELDPDLASPGHWLLVEDEAGRPVMGFLTKPGENGTLLLSLEGACSLAATLMHDGDDFPRRYVYATDEGNENELGRPAFVLRAENVEGCPVARWAGFRLLCVD